MFFFSMLFQETVVFCWAETTAKLIHIRKYLISHNNMSCHRNIFQSKASLGLRDHFLLKYCMLLTRDCWHTLEANKIWAIMYLMMAEEAQPYPTPALSLNWYSLHSVDSMSALLQRLKNNWEHCWHNVQILKLLLCSAIEHCEIELQY